MLVNLVHYEHLNYIILARDSCAYAHTLMHIIFDVSLTLNMFFKYFHYKKSGHCINELLALDDADPI